MKRLILLLAALAACAGAMAQGVDFAKYFENRTMRFDYYHCGDARSEEFFFDELRAEPYWAGSRVSLVDTTNYGNHLFKIIDKATGETIYSRGFCTLFNEWQHTPEAGSVRRAFPESVVFPFPKQPCRIEFYSRDGKNRFVKLFEQDIDPASYFIREFRPEYETFEVAYNGIPEHRVDIVLLPEGYSADQREVFEQDCRHFVSEFFSYSPFRENFHRFNVRAVWAPSAEAGVTMPGEGIWRNTSCDANFYTFGWERYQTVSDQQGLRDLAAHVPYDYIYVLSNTQKYGGGGIFNFYGISAAHHPSTTGQVYVHEFGHVMVGLGDEYIDDAADMYDTAVEPWEANLTTLRDFKSKPWSGMIQDGTPTPTPDSSEYDGVTGLFEGGGYMRKGIYRPARDCVMHSNNTREFCAACRHALESYMDFLCK